MLKYLVTHRFNLIDAFGMAFAGVCFKDGQVAAGLLFAVVGSFLSVSLEHYVRECEASDGSV